MKLGIIGTGKIVQAFLPTLSSLENVEIIAMQSTERSFESACELAKQYGIPTVTTDFHELYSAGIDTVYIATPNFLHYSNCKEVLNAGLNAIVEKPFTSTDAEAEELAFIAKGRNLFLFEAITTLYLENYRKIQEWLPRLGTIKLVESKYSQYSSRYDAFKNGEILPAFDPEKSGGALMDINLYNLHFVLGLFGRPLSQKYYANIERNIDTSGILAMQYPGFQAVCIGAKDCEGDYGSIIQGTDGTIRTELPPGLIGKVTLKLHDGTVEEFDDGMARQREVPEFKAFAKAIEENDLTFCYEMLEKSLTVSQVQTAARLDAGIRFKADQ